MMIPLVGTTSLAVSRSVAIGLLATIIGSTTTLVDNNSSISPPPPTPTQQQESIPVLEIIKIYGKFAGPEFLGKKAPPNSSCEITLKDVERTLQLGGGSSSSSSLSSSSKKETILSEEEFRDILERAEFQWPLKPYGIDKSLSKTATMNKGAETKVYMDLLEERGLYDRRNPAGPLPTSLRPQLNQQLQKEGIDSNAVHKIFQLMGGVDGQLETQKIRNMFENNNMDYYGFLEFVGKESIKWPY